MTLRQVQGDSRGAAIPRHLAWREPPRRRGGTRRGHERRGIIQRAPRGLCLRGAALNAPRTLRPARMRRGMSLRNGIGEKVAMVFPGQGSQFVGMGRALYDASAAARRVFDQADEILGFPLSKLCFEGPAEELEDTINAQPAILTVSVAMLEALKERAQSLGERLTPTVVAGHSLGEFSALVAADVLDFSSALRL